MKDGTLLALRKSNPQPKEPQAPPRILGVADVRALLGNRKSAWWVKRHFAPDSRFKIGRDSVWYETDAYGWLDAQREAR